MKRILLIACILMLAQVSSAALVFEKNWGQLGYTGPNTLIIDDTDIAFREITLNVKNTANAVWITLTRSDLKPAVVAERAGENTYQYIETETMNLYNHNIKNGTVKFDIREEWFTVNNLDPESVALRWYDNYVWKTLDTRRIDTNLYEADIVGLAVFGIVAENATGMTTTTVATTSTLAATTTLPVTTTTIQQKEEANPVMYLVILTLIVIVILIALILRRRNNPV